jgi:hypothetical protein
VKSRRIVYKPVNDEVDDDKISSDYIKLAQPIRTPCPVFYRNNFCIEDPAINFYMNKYGALPALAG